MRCPRCGIEMNRHAEKLLKTLDVQDSLLADQEMEGVLVSIYYCPNCGKVEEVHQTTA